jgi:xylulose-5-phosphate/fructose-6-phosphate phosphoketolase
MTEDICFDQAVNFLAAAQIYLQDNCLLGHCGTAPGINLIYAHLNHLIRDHDANVLLITGPGTAQQPT